MMVSGYKSLGILCNPFMGLESAEKFYFKDSIYNINCNNIIVVGKQYKHIISNIADYLTKRISGASIIVGKFGSGKTSVALAAYCEARERLGSERLSPLVVYLQARDIPASGNFPDNVIVDVVTLISLAIAVRALCVLKMRNKEAYENLINRIESVTEKIKYPLKSLIKEIKKSSCDRNIEHNIIIKVYNELNFTAKTKCEEARPKLLGLIKAAHELLVNINKYAGVPLYIIIDQFDNIIKDFGLLAGEGASITSISGIRRCLELRDFTHNFVKATVLHEPGSSIYYAMLLLPGLEYALIGGETPYGLGISIERLEGLKKDEEVKELIDRFFSVQLELGSHRRGPCYRGSHKPSEWLFTNDSISKLKELKYPRDIIITLNKVIEKAVEAGVKPPIRGDFVERAINEALRGFDPETCIEPNKESIIADYYPRHLLNNVISALRELATSRESWVRVEVVNIAGKVNPSGVVFKVKDPNTQKDTSIAVIAGRKRVDIKSFRNVLGINEDAMQMQYKVDRVITFSINGIASTTQARLARLGLGKDKVVDIRLREVAKASSGDDRVKLKVLGCLENPEDAESVIKALLFLAKVR